MNFRLFFEIHKTKFKIIASIIVVILLLGIIVYKIITNPENNIPFYNGISKNTYTTIKSSDSSFEISLNNNYELNQSDSTTYVLYINNSEDFSFTVSLVKKYHFTLKETIESDQQTFLNTLGNYENLSDIYESKYQNISGYSYSLNYTNNSQEYKLTEFITEINNNFYFFDIQYPAQYESKYEPLKDELLNSISF